MEWQFNLTVILFLLMVGALFGLLAGFVLGRRERRKRAQIRTEQAQLEQRISEPITYTQGAAYDACLGPETDHDAVARRLLNF